MAVGGRRCATGSDTLAIGDRRCVVSIGDDASSLRDSSGGGFEPGLKHADGNSTDSADSSDGGSDSSTGGGFGDGRSENSVNSRDSSGGGFGSSLTGYQHQGHQLLFAQGSCHVHTSQHDAFEPTQERSHHEVETIPRRSEVKMTADLITVR